MNTDLLRGAYETFLTTRPRAESPPGEWNTVEILAHVCLITAATHSTVSALMSGVVVPYDNRLSQDSWTLTRTIDLAGGEVGLRQRVRTQGEALCILATILTETELSMRIPALLISNGVLMVNEPLSLGEILTGFADAELPGHTKQL